MLDALWNESDSDSGEESDRVARPVESEYQNEAGGQEVREVG